MRGARRRRKKHKRWRSICGSLAALRRHNRAGAAINRRQQRMRHGTAGAQASKAAARSAAAAAPLAQKISCGAYAPARQRKSLRSAHGEEARHAKQAAHRRHRSDARRNLLRLAAGGWRARRTKTENAQNKRRNTRSDIKCVKRLEGSTEIAPTPAHRGTPLARVERTHAPASAAALFIGVTGGISINHCGLSKICILRSGITWQRIVAAAAYRSCGKTLKRRDSGGGMYHRRPGEIFTCYRSPVSRTYRWKPTALTWRCQYASSLLHDAEIHYRCTPSPTKKSYNNTTLAKPPGK